MAILLIKMVEILLYKEVPWQTTSLWSVLKAKPHPLPWLVSLTVLVISTEAKTDFWLAETLQMTELAPSRCS